MDKYYKPIIILGTLCVVIFGSKFAYNGFNEKVLADRKKEISIATPKEQEKSNDKQGEEKEKIAAPDFYVFDGEGNKVQFAKTLGKPVVLNFWASWCGPCKSEMPEFQKAFDNKELKGDVVFMMVDLADGVQETVEGGKKFVSDAGFTFPVFFDSDLDGQSVYGVNSIPATIFIDKDGYIVSGIEGALTYEQLESGIKSINIK